MNKKIYRNMWLGFLCLIMLLGVCCQKNNPGSLSPKSKITLLFSNIDEYIFGPRWSLQPASFMFLPLLTRTQNRESEGVLIESWETENLTRTYHMRKNIRWHDGVQVTAHDIEFTLNLLGHPDVLEINPNTFDFEFIDDFTFSITWHNNSHRELIEYTPLGCSPRHLLKDLNPKDYSHWDFWKQPVGDGPFRYVRHIPKTMSELESNPDYYLGEPKIKHVFSEVWWESSDRDSLRGSGLFRNRDDGIHAFET